MDNWNKKHDTRFGLLYTKFGKWFVIIILSAIILSVILKVLGVID